MLAKLLNFSAAIGTPKCDVIQHQKQHFFGPSRKNRAMKIAKPQLKTKQITIRVPLELYAQLETCAAEQAWTVNAEINHRLRAGPVLEQLRAMQAEIAELKGMVRDGQKGGV